MNPQPEENSDPKKLEFKFVDEDTFEEFTSEWRKEIFKDHLAVYNRIILSREEFQISEPYIERFSNLENIYCLLMLGEKCIGWHYGHQDGPMSYYMTNSAIIPEYRRKGYYSLLAKMILEEITRRGYHNIKSRHYPTNNAVIIAKLKLGFIITGFQLSANFGTLVELEWNANQKIAELFKFRCGDKLPSDSSLQALGLKRNDSFRF